jgi:hypothetical protein
MWIVKLTKVNDRVYNTYPRSYFPRLFRYKRDALALRSNVTHVHGCEAVVEKMVKKPCELSGCEGQRR